METKIHVKIGKILLRHKKEIQDDYVFPGAKEANSNLQSTNTFFLGAVMDYQMDADVVWKNAEELVKTLGAAGLN